MKNIKKRTILLIVAIVLLVGVLLYTTVAWYTRMTSVRGLSFAAARWDFSANFQEDDFEIDVYKYTNIGALGQPDARFAAPGTRGEINIDLSAGKSNTDVGYIIRLNKATMSEEFQKRLYFYYETTDENDGEVQVYPELSDGSEDPWNGKRFVELKETGADQRFITGVVPYGETKTVKIYWKWIYDYDEYLEITDEDTYEFAQLIRPIFESPVGTILNPDDFILLYQYKYNETSNYNADVHRLCNILDKLRQTELNTLYEAVDPLNEEHKLADFTLLSDEEKAFIVSTFGANKESDDTDGSIKKIYEARTFSFENLWNSVGADTYKMLMILKSKYDKYPTLTESFITGPSTANPEIVAGSGNYLFTEDEYLFFINFYANLGRDTDNYFTSLTQLWNNFLSAAGSSVYNVYGILNTLTDTERAIFFEDEKVDSSLSKYMNGEIITKLRNYVTNSHLSSLTEAVEKYIKAYDEFDEFDTLVGTDPEYYQSKMKATVKITGNQTIPDLITDSASETTSDPTETTSDPS